MRSHDVVRCGACLRSGRLPAGKALVAIHDCADDTWGVFQPTERWLAARTDAELCGLAADFPEPVDERRVVRPLGRAPFGRGSCRACGGTFRSKAPPPMAVAAAIHLCGIDAWLTFPTERYAASLSDEQMGAVAGIDARRLCRVLRP